MNEVIKKRIYIIGLFVISFVFISIALIQNIRPKSAIGTYCTGEGLSRDDVYISLLSDNTFLIYRQLETGLSGKFDSEEFENLTTLNSLVFVGKFINDISCPLEFKRISSTPININVLGDP